MLSDLIASRKIQIIEGTNSVKYICDKCIIYKIIIIIVKLYSAYIMKLRITLPVYADNKAVDHGFI